MHYGIYCHESPNESGLCAFEFKFKTLDDFKRRFRQLNVTNYTTSLTDNYSVDTTCVC